MQTLPRDAEFERKLEGYLMSCWSGSLASKDSAYVHDSFRCRPWQFSEKHRLKQERAEIESMGSALINANYKDPKTLQQLIALFPSAKWIEKYL